MAGAVGNLSFMLSIVICCNLIVSSSKSATTHSGNVKGNCAKKLPTHKFQPMTVSE